MDLVLGREMATGLPRNVLHHPRRRSLLLESQPQICAIGAAREYLAIHRPIHPYWNEITAVANRLVLNLVGNEIAVER